MHLIERLQNWTKCAWGVCAESSTWRTSNGQGLLWQRRLYAEAQGMIDEGLTESRSQGSQGTHLAMILARSCSRLAFSASNPIFRASSSANLASARRSLSRTRFWSRMSFDLGVRAASGPIGPCRKAPLQVNNADLICLARHFGFDIIHCDKLGLLLRQQMPPPGTKMALHISVSWQLMNRLLAFQKGQPSKDKGSAVRLLMSYRPFSEHRH